ncbi:MAG: LamG-like jellyroll fold domain-containing protein [Cyanobacteria bacterium P01_F01_bin.150]
MALSFATLNITDLPAEILIANPGLTNAIANDNQDDANTIQTVVDWLTGQRAMGVMDETTIYIPAGTFDLATSIEVDTPNIIFEGAGPGLTVLQNANTFQVDTAELVDVGVNINSVNRDAYLFDLDKNADNVIFRDLTVTGAEVHGAIFGVRLDDLEISEVEFNDFAWSSIRLFNSSNAKIHNNVFLDAGGQAKNGATGGSIYGTFLADSEIYNNVISRSENREINVFGIKGRQFRNTRIHHNTINAGFAIELPFENDHFVEIDHNFLNGAVSIPKFGGGSVPDNGFTFHIHHNYFQRSYSLEWARNGAEIDHNVFALDIEQDRGNLISNFGDEAAEGPTKFHNNLIINPGRGIFWSAGVYNNFSFYNNEIIANETVTPRSEGLFSFNDNTDFSTIEIKDNIISVNGIPRPLIRREASYAATIENNTLINVSDADQFDNLNTGAPRGLLAPLLFTVGARDEFTVDGANLSPTENGGLPTLSITIDPVSISENGGLATATVIRETATNGDLTVTLFSSDTNAATVPAAVTIADGETSASFTITAVDDPVFDHTQIPTIRASATGFFPGFNTISVTNDEMPTRITNQLLALYTFDEGTGNIVGDTSGVGTALDLTIEDPSDVTWGTGTLTLNDPTIITSPGLATKLTDGLKTTNELTIEAWIAPENTTQKGPARIATLSRGSHKRNVTLGQNGDKYDVRLRTTATNKNGTPSVSSPNGSVTTDLTHVVYTREADGDVSVYLNGELVTTGNRSGDFSNWANDYQFILGNELGSNRGWLGTYDLIALYNKAFDLNDVSQNFQAGPNDIVSGL